MYASRSKAQLLGRFFSNAAVYGISLVITRIGWLFLLPLYWTKLSPADYGVIGIAQVFQLVLGPLLSLGLYDSLQRYYFEYDETERPRCAAGLWSFSLVFSLVFCVLVEITGTWMGLEIFSQVPFEPYLRIAVWTAFFTNLGLFPLAILRSREQIRKFSLLTIGSFVTQAGITIFLVIFLELGVKGYLLGALLNSMFWAAWYVGFMFYNMEFPFRRFHVEKPLRYALPTVPVSILDGVANILDRYFLDKFVGLSQIGLYTLANQFGSAFNIFNQTLKSSWVPFLYRLDSERHDAPEILARFSVIYLAVLTVPALAVALLSKELIVWFGDERFFGVYSFVPAFVLVYYLQSIIAAMGRGMDLAKKTFLWPLVPVAAIITSIVCLYLLVPRYGTWGAIYALIIAGCVRGLIQIGLSHHFYPRPLHLRQLLAVAAFAGGAFYVGFHIDVSSMLVSAALKTLVVAVSALGIAWVVLGKKLLLSLVNRVVPKPF